MPAKEISIQSASQDKLFYVVANVIVYRESDKRCLLLQRSEHEKVHPGKYCVPGGKLEWSQFPVDTPTRLNGDVLDYENAIEELLIREVREEAGIEIGRDLFYINSVGYIRPDGIPSILIKFAAKYISGEVSPEKGSFQGYTWANKEEAANLECIAGINDEILATITLFGQQ